MGIGWRLSRGLLGGYDLEGVGVMMKNGTTKILWGDVVVYFLVLCWS